MIFSLCLLSLSLSLSPRCRATDHDTQSEEELGKQKMGDHILVYPSTDSVVDKDWRNRSFFNNWNQGSRQFSRRIHNLMEISPF